MMNQSRHWPTVCVVAAIAVVCIHGTSSAAPVSEVEPNNFISQAQNLDGSFTLDFDANIGDSAGNNTSTTLQHASVNGSGSNGFMGLGIDNDYFSFTVAEDGSRGIFDIDSVAPISALTLFLFDAAGQLIDQSQSLLALGILSPDTGSLSLNDPYLEHTFASAGVYYLGVGGPGSIATDGGIITASGPSPTDNYTLHASVALPEPMSLILFGTGAAGLAFYRRRKGPLVKDRPDEPAAL